MRTLLLLSLLVLVGSCGKYKRPFITFKSPEERLTDKDWECVKAVDTDGNEFQVGDKIQFSINGTDSTLTRVSNNPVLMANVNQTVNDTIICDWTWVYNTLDGSFNKQQIIQSNPYKILRVISLSSRVLVLQDESVNNTMYHYESN